MTEVYPLHRRAAAWAVHLYTALGLPIALIATAALYRTDPGPDMRLFFLMLIAAIFVDATDGTMARAVKVNEVLPQFSGAHLDDLVDFLIFAFLPSLALPVLGMLPEGYEFIAFLPLMASGYGFCQDNAKTEESFVGFPSYWNIGLLYLVLLQTSPWTNVAIICFFVVMVFVPIHYIYPTRTRFLRPLTLGFGTLWAVLMTVLAMNIGAEWTYDLAVYSLVYPFYYFAMSAVHHVRVHRVPAQ